MSRNAVAWAATTLLPIVSCLPPGPHHVSPPPKTPAGGIDVKALAPHLSPSAELYVQGSDAFDAYTIRWSNLDPPSPNVVVVVSNEQDVAKTVRTWRLYDTMIGTLTRMSRSSSLSIMMFLFLLTTGTMALLPPLGIWIMVFKYTSLD